MQKLVFLILGLSALANADVTPKTSPDAWADNILQHLKKKIVDDGLDPFMLPIKSFEFQKKILFVEVTGVAKIYDGWLKGLSSIHRTGLTSHTNTDTLINVKTTIGLSELQGQIKATAKIAKFGPSFKLALGVESVGIMFEVEQPKKNGSVIGKPVLKSFHVLDLGKVTAQVEGPIGILNWLINTVTNFVISWLKTIVITIVEIPLKAKLQEVLLITGLPDFITEQ